MTTRPTRSQRIAKEMLAVIEEFVRDAQGYSPCLDGRGDITTSLSLIDRAERVVKRAKGEQA